MISDRKIEQIKKELERLEIQEKDLQEKFILSSGKGGQKANKTHACVQLTHLPSKIQIKCEKERDRHSNRWLARRKLCEIYQKEVLKEKTDKDKALEKKRKQKKRRQRKSQLKHDP